MRTVTPSLCTVTLLTISLTCDNLVSSGLLENQWHAVLLENRLFRVFKCEIARKREISVWRKARNTCRDILYSFDFISPSCFISPPLLVVLFKPFWVLNSGQIVWLCGHRASTTLSTIIANSSRKLRNLLGASVFHYLRAWNVIVIVIVCCHLATDVFHRWDWLKPHRRTALGH